MFAPMTSQSEYARFEAETRERTRRAQLEATFSSAPRSSLISRLIARFTAQPVQRPTPALKATTSEHPAAAC